MQTPPRRSLDGHGFHGHSHSRRVREGDLSNSPSPKSRHFSLQQHSPSLLSVPTVPGSPTSGTSNMTPRMPLPPHDINLASLAKDSGLEFGRPDNIHDAAIAETNTRALGLFGFEARAGDQSGPSRASALTGSIFPDVQEPIFDPFSGVSAGTLTAASGTANRLKPIPKSSIDSETGAILPQDGQPLAESSNGMWQKSMWAQLSEIRVLQSDVARLHMEMECTGPGPGKHTVGQNMGLGPAMGPGPGKDKDRKGSGEKDKDKVADAGTREQSRKSTPIGDMFAARQEQVDKIMVKLDKLSQAVTTFHNLPPPQINFSSPSRMSTQSTAVGPPITTPQAPFAGFPSSPLPYVASPSAMSPPLLMTPRLSTIHDSPRTSYIDSPI